MVSKLVRFSLKKEGVTFSEKQKRNIEMHVDYEKNWRKFKDLESIELVTIDDNSFSAQVVEKRGSWHQNFSRILNEKAMLEDLCVVSTNGRHLFNINFVD